MKGSAGPVIQVMAGIKWPTDSAAGLTLIVVAKPGQAVHKLTLGHI